MVLKELLITFEKNHIAKWVLYIVYLSEDWKEIWKWRNTNWMQIRI